MVFARKYRGHEKPWSVPYSSAIPPIYLHEKVLRDALVVEDVIFDEDEEGFFLVQLIDEASADDMGAMGDELDPDEWFALVEQYGLVKSES